MDGTGENRIAEEEGKKEERKEKNRGGGGESEKGENEAFSPTCFLFAPSLHCENLRLLACWREHLNVKPPVVLKVSHCVLFQNVFFKHSQIFNKTGAI